MITAGAASGFYGYNANGSTSTQSFAIPINTALSIVQSIEAGHAASGVHIGKTPYLGVEVAPTRAAGFGGFGSVTPAATSGIVIAGLVAGSPAASSTLAVGDTITSIDGHAVATVAALSQFEANLKVGDTVTIGYTNSAGVAKSATMSLAAGPPQ
jgi:S1-C subfamily serine protease